MGALGLSRIVNSASNTKVGGTSSATERFNNGGQRENRTWSYPTLRFLIVCSCRQTTADRTAAYRKRRRVSGCEISLSWFQNRCLRKQAPARFTQAKIWRIAT